MKRYSDDQIDAAMLTAMERANALETNEQTREYGQTQIDRIREGLGKIGDPDPMMIQMRLHLRLFLEAIHQMSPARPGTPEERQQRIADRIEKRQAKRGSKGQRR